MHDILAQRPKAKNWKGREAHPYCIAQPKMDGRYLSICRLGGKVYAFSKKHELRHDYGPELRDGDHMVARVLAHAENLPDYTIVDGELYVPGAPASDVITAVQEGWDTLRWTPFALPLLSERDLRFVDLILATDKLNRVCSRALDCLPVHTHWNVGHYDEDHWVAQALAENHEGFMLKDDHYQTWYKVKPVQTVDAVVTGFTLSESLTKWGALKALQVSVVEDWDGSLETSTVREIASVGTGFSDDFRYECDPPALVGEVIEVSYQSVQASRLQFPRFVRFRDDKDASECGTDQLK